MEIPKYEKAKIINNFTMSIWVKPSPQLIGQRFLISLLSDEPPLFNAHSMSLERTNNNYESWNGICKCDSTNGSRSCDIQQYHQYFADPTDKWTNIIFGQDNQNAFLFINGLKLMIGGRNNSPISFTHGGIIGAVLYGNYGFYIGDLDDIRIYNRALSTEEILRLFNQKS